MEKGSNMICRYVVACSRASDDRIKNSKLKLTKNLASKHQDMHQRVKAKIFSSPITYFFVHNKKH